MQQEGSQRQNDQQQREDSRARQVDRPVADAGIDAGDENVKAGAAAERGGCAVFLDRCREDQQQAGRQTGCGEWQGDAQERSRWGGTENPANIGIARADRFDGPRHREIDDRKGVEGHDKRHAEQRK